MKKIISRILIIFIILIMMFEFVFSSRYSYAASWWESAINEVTNLAGGIASIIFWPKRLTAVSLAFVIDMLTAQLARDSGINESNGISDLLITPFDIFFNKYKLLDINFFDFENVSEGSIVYMFRVTVANWYYALRLLAMIILLVILVYVGIRMALSSIADDKAKYKKMLVDWCVSLVLIFIMHYIAIFVIYTNNAIVDALKSGLTDLNAEKQLTSILVDIGLNGVIGIGITALASVLVFIFIVFQTIAFLLAYINRVIKIGFLLLISPLITLTYSIDKMGDGKAQSLGTWLKEFIFTVLIQPFHCLMYMAFVRPAITLLTGNGLGYAAMFDPSYNQLVNAILAILCLKFINDGEKIVRKIFGFADDNSSTSMAAGMAVGMLAVKNAQKIGKTARKGINTTKNSLGKLGKAMGKDGSKLSSDIKTRLDSEILKNPNNKFLQGLRSTGNTLGKAANKTAGAFKSGYNFATNNKVIRGAKSFSGKLHKAANQGGVKGFLAKQTLKHNSLASTLGLMGAAMAYSTGSTDALSAIGTGSAIQRGTQEMFATSDNNLANIEAFKQMEQDKQDFENLKDDIEETKKDIEEDTKALEDEDGYKDFNSKMSKADEEDKAAEAKKAEAEEELKKAEEEEALAKATDNKKHRRAHQQHLKQAEEARKNAAKLEEEAKQKEANAASLRNDAYGLEHSDKFQRMYDAETELKKNNSDASEEDLKAARRGALDIGANESKLATLERQKKEFLTEKALRERNEGRRITASKAEIQSKKDEIAKKLAALVLKQKEGSKDGTTRNVITADEQDSINRTAEQIYKETELGAAGGQKFTDTRLNEIIQSNLGIRDSSAIKNSRIYRTATDYQDMLQRKQTAATYSKQTQYGGDNTRLSRRITEKMIDAYASQGIKIDRDQDPKGTISQNGASM